MAAYVIADLEVHDAAGYETYKQGVGASVARFGGRFLVRGGQVKALEGDWKPSRLVILEFPDMAALEAWYSSADYKPLLNMRLAASSGRLISAEGT